MRARCDKGCGRILLGDATGDGAGVLRPFRFQCVSLIYIYIYIYLEGDQKVSLHLMITIHKVTSNVLSVPRQSPDTRHTIYTNAICYL
jgi:hypothetical protein